MNYGLRSFRGLTTCIVTATLVAIIPGAGLCQIDNGLAPLLAQPDTLNEASAKRDEATPPQPALPKLSIPDAGERRAAVGKVREIFADDLANCTTPDKKRALSSRLKSLADDSRNPSERWALLSESLKLATGAGDAASAIALIDQLASEFRSISAEESLEMLSSLAAKVPGDQVSVVVRSMLAVVRRMSDTDSDVLINKTLTSIASLAKRSKEPALIAEVLELQVAQKERIKDRKQLLAMEAKLAAAPEDPDICLEAGKFFCFERADWFRGLPLLVKSADSALVALARKDLAAQRDQSNQLAAADAWWDWSESQRANIRDGAQSRAAAIYEKFVDAASGLEKTRLEKRISSVLMRAGSRLGSAREKIPGLILWLDATVPESIIASAGRSGQPARVSKWRDLSGMGHDAVQPNPAKQPVVIGTSPSETPAILFDGQTTLAVPMPCEVTGTIVCVITPEAGNKSMRVLGCIPRPGAYVGISLRAGGVLWAEASSRGDATTLSQSPPNSYSAKQPIVVAQSWGSALQLYRNGTALGPKTQVPAGVKLPGPWGVGGATLDMNIEYFVGSIAEVMVFERELAERELAAISKEKLRKWRVP